MGGAQAAQGDGDRRRGQARARRRTRRRRRAAPRWATSCATASTANPHVLFGTARLWDDGILDPRDTRRVLALALALAREADARASCAANTFGVARF